MSGHGAAGPAAGTGRRMLARLIRVAAAALAALAILLVGGAGLGLLAFHTDAFKSVLIDSVLQRYHRRLELPGTLQLRLFPPFTLETGPMRLSAADGHSPFAEAADMRLRLAPLALLRRHVEIEAIELDAPRLQLRRDTDGRWNFADLLAAPGARLPALDVRRLVIKAATIRVSDAAGRLDGTLRGVDADIAGIGVAGWHPLSVSGQAMLPRARSQARFTLLGQLHTEASGRAWVRDLVLRGDARLSGGARLLGDLHANLQWNTGASQPWLQLAGLQLRAQGRLADGQPAQLQLAEPLLQWQGQRTLGGPLHGWALIGAAPRTLRLQLSSSGLGGPDSDLALPELRLSAARSAPTPLRLRLRLGGRLDLVHGSAVIDHLQAGASWGAPTQSTHWQVSGSGSFAPDQGLQLQLQGDDAASALHLQARRDQQGWSLAAQAGAIDLGKVDGTSLRPARELLRALPPARLQLQARSLRWRALQLSQLTLQAHDSASALVLDQLRARAWGGELQASGRLGLAAGDGQLQARLQQASMPRLLQALYGNAVLSGSGDLRADLRWQRPGPILPQAEGSARVQVDGGRLLGVDLLRPRATQTRAFSSFRQLDAQAAIRDGVVELTRLRLQAADGDWAGGGSYDLATRQLRLRLRPGARPRQPAWLAAGHWRVRGEPGSPRFDWRAGAAAATQSPK